MLAIAMYATLVLEHANMVGLGGEPQRLDRTIVITDGRIASISGPIPPGAERIDLHGLWVIPGLIEGHSHTATVPGAHRMLEMGVTTGRSMMTNAWADVGLKALHARGDRDIPTFLAAGYPVMAWAGKFKPDLSSIFFEPSLMELRGRERIGVEGARRVVEADLARHVDFIKLFANGRAGLPETEPSARDLNDEELVVAAAAARKGGALAAAHAYTDDAVMAAIKAGVRTIEHGALIGETTIAVMKERGVCWDPTLIAYQEFLKKAVAAEPKSPLHTLEPRALRLSASAKAGLAVARRLGTRVVAGADTNYEPGSPTLVDEILLLVEAGFTAREALEAATVTAARCYDLASRKGALRPGFDADVVGYRRDPTVDPATLRDPALVVNAGAIIVDHVAH